jgi:hypothetical protein
MKKIFFLLCIGLFMANTVFSQMSINGNAVKKSAFVLNPNKTELLNLADNKILISTEEKEMMAKRRRSRSSSSSDGGAFVNLSFGYGLGLGSQNITGFSDKNDDTTSISTEDQVDVSLGKGLCIKLGLGYMINGNIGFELGASYLLGGKSTATTTSPFGFNKTKTIESSYYSSMFMINPSVLIASGSEGINPYAKFGLVLGFGSFYFEKNSTADTFITIQKTQYSGGIALGFNASLGCSFTVSDNISIFAEFNMLNMSYSPDKSEIITSTSQGKDLLPDYTVRDKQTDYYETLVSTSMSPLPDTVPNQKLKQSFSFGNIGLNLGVKFNF